MDTKKIIKAPYNYVRNDIKNTLDYLLEGHTLSDALGGLTAGMSPLSMIAGSGHSPKLSDIATSWLPDVDKIKLRNQQTLQNHISKSNKTSEKYIKQQQASFDRLDNSIKTSTSVNANILKSSQDYHKVSVQQLASIAESSKQSAQSLKDISKTSKISSSITTKLFSLLLKVGPLAATGYTAYSFMKDKHLINKGKDLLNPSKIITSAQSNKDLKNWYVDLANEFAINTTKKYVPSLTPIISILNSIRNTQKTIDKLYLNITNPDILEKRFMTFLTGKHYVGQFENLKDKLKSVKAGTYGQEFTANTFINDEYFRNLENLYRKSRKQKGKYNAEITSELTKIRQNIKNNALEFNENKSFSDSVIGKQFFNLIKESNDYNREETIDSIAAILGNAKSVSLKEYKKKHKNIPTDKLIETWAKSTYGNTVITDIKRLYQQRDEATNDKDRKKAIHDIAELLSGSQSVSFIYYTSRHKNMSADQLLKNWAKENKIPLENIIEGYKPSKTRLNVANVLQKVFNTNGLPSMLTYAKTLNNPFINMGLPLIEKQLPLTTKQKIYMYSFEKFLEHFPKLAPAVGVYQALNIRKSLGKGNLIDTGVKKFAEMANLDKMISEHAETLMNSEITEKNLIGKENTPEYKEINERYKNAEKHAKGYVTNAPKNIQGVIKSTLGQRLIDSMAQTNLSGALALQVATGHSMRAVKTFLSTTKTFGPIVRGVQTVMDVFKGVGATIGGLYKGIKDFGPDFAKTVGKDWTNLKVQTNYIGQVKAFSKFAWSSFKKIIFGGLIKSMFKGAVRSLIKVFTGITWPIPGLGDTENLLAASLIGQNTLTTVTGELIGKTISVEESIFATVKKFFSDIYDDTFGAVRVVFSKGKKGSSSDNAGNSSAGGSNYRPNNKKTGSNWNRNWKEKNKNKNGANSNTSYQNIIFSNWKSVKVDPNSVRGSATIVNPTEISVNITIIDDENVIINTKGTEEIAKQIKEISKQKGIPVITNIELARTLNALPVNKSIPSEIAQYVINFVTNAISKMKMIGNKIITGVKNIVNKYIKNPYNKIKSGIKTGFNFITHPIQSAKEIIGSGLNFTRNIYQSAKEKVKNGIDFIKHPIRSIRESVENGINTITHPIQSLKNVFKSTNLFSVYRKKVPDIKLPEGNKLTQTNLLAMIAATLLSEKKTKKKDSLFDFVKKGLLDILKGVVGSIGDLLAFLASGGIFVLLKKLFHPGGNTPKPPSSGHPILKKIGSLGFGLAGLGAGALGWAGSKAKSGLGWAGKKGSDVRDWLTEKGKSAKDWTKGWNTKGSPGLEPGLATAFGIHPESLNISNILKSLNVKTGWDLESKLGMSALGMHNNVSGKDVILAGLSILAPELLTDILGSATPATVSAVAGMGMLPTKNEVVEKFLKRENQRKKVATSAKPLFNNKSNYNVFDKSFSYDTNNNISKVSNQDLSKVNDVGTIMYKSMKQSIIDAYTEMGIYNPSRTKSNRRVQPVVNNIPRTNPNVSSEMYNIIYGSYPSVT